MSLTCLSNTVPAQLGMVGFGIWIEMPSVGLLCLKNKMFSYCIWQKKNRNKMLLKTQLKRHMQ